MFTRAVAFIGGVPLILVFDACSGRDSTAPQVELTVSAVYAQTSATCDFDYTCTQGVRYVTTDLATGRNVAGEVAISGAGTHPPTATSGPLGVGDFIWVYSAQPGTQQITVCPNVPAPLQTRCRTMDVSIGP